MSEHKMNQRPCYIFDIDGTIADCSHRLHHIQKEPKDWDAFFVGCLDDRPIEHMLTLAVILRQNGSIVFVSGRPAACLEDTREWLARQGFGGATPLYMRDHRDRRDDDIVKSELLDRVLADGWRPIMVFEDRARVVKMWRSRGIPCAQVANGDF